MLEDRASCPSATGFENCSVLWFGYHGSSWRGWQTWPYVWPSLTLLFSFAYQLSSVQFSRSVASDSLRHHGLQYARPPCPSRTPGASHAHWVGDAIQPSHPLSSPSPSFNHSQHQGLFKWVICLYVCIIHGFSGGSVVKNLPVNAGDTSSVPDPGTSWGEGNGNLLQYSCLGNPMDRETWAVLVYVVIKSGTSLSDSLTSYIIHSRIANNLILTIVFVIVMDLIFWWYKIYSMGIFRNMKSKPNFCSGSFCMCMYL